MNDSKKEERLNKYLADCGICSRREADRMIEAGRVIVNGVPAQMGMRISETDDITVDGRPLDKKDRKVVLAYYKPVGVTCTEKDKYAEKTIRDAIDYPIRVTYAGRLDKDSEGLLLLTNDGDLINGLMRAANYHEKEYLVRVNKPITDTFLQNGGRSFSERAQCTDPSLPGGKRRKICFPDRTHPGIEQTDQADVPCSGI